MAHDNKSAMHPLAIVALVLAVLMGVLVCGVIVAGVVFANRARQAATEQFQAARQQAMPMESADQFLRETLVASIEGIDEDTRGDTTVIAILDDASDRLPGRFDDAPAVEAAIRLTLGIAYDDAGEDQKAAAHLRRGLALRTPDGRDDERTIDAMRRLTGILARQDLFDEAESWGDRALMLAEEAGLMRTATAVRTRLTLAALKVRAGEMADAETRYVAALETARVVQGDRGPLTLRAYDGLAAVYEQAGRYEESAAIRQRVLDVHRRDTGPRSPETLRAMADLCRVWAADDRLEQAWPLAQSAVETSRAALGADHPATLACMSAFADLLRRRGDPDAARDLYRNVLEKQQAVLGPGARDTLQTMAGLLRAMDASPERDALLEAYRDRGGVDVR